MITIPAIARRAALMLLVLLATRPAGTQTPVSSLLIVGGTVVDGSGKPGRHADIRIEGDHIVAVGNLKVRSNGERTIDAHGLVVAPGFIDTHSHADGGLLESPDAESQIRQGITTSVVGQDGGSHFPLSDYFRQVEEKHVAINLASFVGHGTVRMEVLGKEFHRAATPDEAQRMRALVEQEMQAGALGLSSGLEYDPGFYSDTAELIACAKGASAHGGLYISHVRDELDKALELFQELIRIAREGHLPAQISHIKLGTTPVWGKAGEVLRMMANARRHGLDITADVYPYLYWQSTITVLIPTRTWDDRAIWQKGLDEVGGASHVLLSSYTPDPTWVGKTIAQIAETTGKDPITVIQEIVRKTHGPGMKGGESVVVTAMTEPDLRAFLADPHIMFCTDGGLHGSHPRGAGSYPRILGRYVREAHLLTLEEAVRKATSLPARRMGFRDRGLIRPGMKADLTLFDPATVLDTATTSDPGAKPVGIVTVLVNGQPVLERGAMTGAHPGMVLRRTNLTTKTPSAPRN